MAAALSVTHGFCHRIRARLRLPPFSMPIWVNPAVRYYSGNPDRDSRRSGLPRVLKGIDKPIPEGLYSAKTSAKKRCRALASASGPLWCRYTDGDACDCRNDPAERSRFPAVAEFLGDPVMATLIAVLIACSPLV